MTPDEEVEGLTRWASRSHAAERSRLLLALANVVAADDLSGRPRAQACLDALLPALALDADAQTRAELTERLADAPWAPSPLLASLAEDPDEIARPLLARSPCLDEASLARAASRADADLQLALARRRNLPPGLIDALLDRADPDALPALAANPAARLTEQQVLRLARSAIDLLPLRPPLLRRTEMTAEAAALLAPHLNAASRLDLTRRFDLREVETPAVEAGAEQRLVQKLQQAGRLTPGFAVRALREGKRMRFEAALAGLTGKPLAAVQQATREGGDDFAGMAQAAGLDRSLLPTLLDRLGLPQETSGMAQPAE